MLDIWWSSTSLLMHKWCNTPFFIVSLSNWSKYFLTALDFILAIADVFGISSAVTHWYTSLRIISFWCYSVIFSGVTGSKMETTFNLLNTSSLSSSSIYWLNHTTDGPCASCLRSSGIFVLLQALIYGLTHQWICNYFYFITIGLALTLDVTWGIEWTVA